MCNAERVLIVARAPVRTADLGGWTDTWFARSGIVTNVAVEPGASATFRSSHNVAKDRVKIRAMGSVVDESIDNPGSWTDPLLASVLAGIRGGLEITIETGVPPGSGLGTSASVVVALRAAMDVLNGCRASQLDQLSIARRAHQHEISTGRQSGVQDHAAAAIAKESGRPTLAAACHMGDWDALPRLVEMGVAPYLLAATLHGVLAQRLVRLTCDVCSAWRPLTSEEQALQRASAQFAVMSSQDPPVMQVREGRGCERCAQTGYRGRAAIAELLVLDDALRAAFAAGASLDVLRAQVRSRGVPSLLHDGWRAVRDGQTTIAEVTRVVSEDERL